MSSGSVVNFACCAGVEVGRTVGLGVVVIEETEFWAGVAIGVGVGVEIEVSVAPELPELPVVAFEVMVMLEADLRVSLLIAILSVVRLAESVLSVKDSVDEPTAVGLNVRVAIVPLPVTPPESGLAATVKEILPLATTGEENGLGKKSPNVTIGVDIFDGS